MKALLGLRFCVLGLILTPFVLTNGIVVGHRRGPEPPAESRSKAVEWYVAPNGKPTNPGSIARPLDLATALKGDQVRPGSTIWLRGGEYHGVFTSRLLGTREAPIVVRQYPGERATLIDGRARAPLGTLNVYGAWTIYQDFEITNMNPDRSFSTQFRPMGVYSEAPNSKFINLIIHDAGHGIGLWKEAVNSELYGNIIFNCGSKNLPTYLSHGHGIYSQNNEGSKYIRDNIIFNQFGWGIHIYPNPGDMKGYDIEGNVVFNNGVLSAPQTRYNNILVSGYVPYQAERITIANNYTYHPGTQVPTPYEGAPVHFSDTNLCLGCSDPQDHKDVKVTDNYFVGGIPTAIVESWQDVTITGNTFYGTNGLVGLITTRKGRPHRYIWDNNTYLGTGWRGTLALFWVNGTPLDFPGWKRLTGVDQRSQYIPGRPKGVKVFVRPNNFQPRVANVIVYNWDLNKSVDVDLGSVLHQGDEYEVRNAEDYFGPTLLTGTYDGRPLKLPMTDLKVAAPLGGLVPESTAPEFGVFVVLKRARRAGNE
jgi:hypothetical protein